MDIVCILREQKQRGREGEGGRQQRAADDYGMQVGGFCCLFQGKTFHLLRREDGLIANGNCDQEFIPEKRNQRFLAHFKSRKKGNINGKMKWSPSAAAMAVFVHLCGCKGRVQASRSWL